MKAFRSAEEILDFAIANEEEASRFYLRLAETAKFPGMAQVFRDFSREEQGHKLKLQEIKRSGRTGALGARVMDLKLSDYVGDVDEAEPVDYQSALILAMKKEKKAFQLYTALSERAEDPALKELLAGMAQEEAKHKLRFELEYDEQILREN